MARVGTRAALNFSFAFLRRAWKSGEDTELCSELLGEALDALQTLPEASLFDTSNMSSIWIEAVEKSIKFLRQVALGDIMGGRCMVPKSDRHIALNLLLELAVQKGTLCSSLEAVLLLLTLWEKDAESEDNRTPPQPSGAPLAAVLRRFERINNHQSYSLSDSISSTESFLRFLTLPEDDTTPIDLKQAAVIIMSHLDRLAKPHLPASDTSCLSKTQHGKPQQIFTLGWNSFSADMEGFNADSIISGPVAADTKQKYSNTITDWCSQIQVQQIVCSESCIHILSSNGQVYLVKSNGSENGIPTLVEGFDGKVVIKIASHCEGKHFMALNTEDQIYVWGCGAGGALGLGDNSSRECPSKIYALADKIVTGIFCGSSYSAAITSSGQLYTWGRGNFGRLGHNSSDDKFIPTLVEALKGHKVVDVALGSGDSHSLCVTDTGLVFAWGDGDFSKLGNNSSNGSQIPIQVEGLTRISRVFSGSQFSVALSVDGMALYTWGRGNGGRLGHGTSDHCTTPKALAALEGKKIVDVAVGSAHCLVLTSNGQVYGFGRNDHQQICHPSITRDPIITTPILTTSVNLRISGIACGATYSIIWCHSSMMGSGGIPVGVPFVIDLTEQAFRLIDQLLCMVCLPQTTQTISTTEARQTTATTPTQESECIAVACLNLLRLQLHAMITNNISPRTVSLYEGSRLLSSLKTRIINLAGGAMILKTMQEAAQKTLQIGWSILLPTAAERAQTLTSLLPSAGHDAASGAAINSGHRFMTDLLVGSLMAEGGLQTALKQAINPEPQEFNNGHHLPLLHLLKQLLRNNTSLTQARLSQLLLGPYIKLEEDSNNYSSAEPLSPSLDLLHKFQR